MRRSPGPASRGPQRRPRATAEVAHILPLRGKKPQVAAQTFLAPTAVLIGDVRIGAGASVWFGAVLRADDPEHPIIVGSGANVQDGAVVHVGRWGPTRIGPRVTVGHGAVMESCRIGEGALIGMKAVVLPGAQIGRECVVAAGAVVLEYAEIPERSLVAGVPGRVVRSFGDVLPAWLTRSSAHYSDLSRLYLEEGFGGSGSPAPARPRGEYAEGDGTGRALASPADARVSGSGEAESITCSLCGSSAVLERHCKLICMSCGYERDCSDP